MAIPSGMMQVQCGRCGQTAWVMTSVGYGVCACGAQVTAPGGAAGAAGAGSSAAGLPQSGGIQSGMAPAGQGAGYSPEQIQQMQAQQMQQMQQMQQGQAAAGGIGGLQGRLLRKFGVGGGIVGAVLVAAIAFGGYTLKNRFMPQKGLVRWSTMGLDADKADGDLMITAVSPAAKKWSKDAVWWAANYQAVRNDGTVDWEKGAMVQYVSPKRLKSYLPKQRDNSMKKFRFGPKGADYKDVWGVKKTVKGEIIAPFAPTCTIKQLAGVLKGKGLADGKTVRISYDPKWERAVAGQNWHVSGDDPKMEAWYSMKDCSLQKEQ